MRCFDLPSTLLLAVYASSVAAVTHNGHRILRAATKRSDLLKRDARIFQKFESEVVYVEGSGRHSSETFASTVKVGSKKPILSLEEIEHLLQRVQCRDGRMLLHFVDAKSAQDARAACYGGHGGMGGVIITSHHSCNRAGERAVYKIDEVTYTEEGIALDLAVTEALWQDAFDNLDITFGYTRHDHVFRQHSEFSRARKKRQDELTVEIPSETSDNVTDVLFNLSSELLDYTFTPNDILTGLGSIANLPISSELPLEIGCRNCSTQGQIVLTQGAIKIDMKQVDLVPDIFEGGDDGKEISSIITGGYMDLALTGVGARLEMFARPIQSGSYEIALVRLPVLGFVLPGIGQAGASFEPKISADFEIDGELAVNYGIDVAIPDSASIRVELGDLTNTTITGIKGAALDALPITSNVTDVDITLSLAFTPTIPIGFEFSNKLSALVTVSLDLPRLDAKLTTGAKEQCSLLKETEAKIDEQSKPRDTDLSELMLVEANISVVVDVAAELALPLLPAPFDSAGISANIFSTEMPLLTSCVSPVKGALRITGMTPVATTKTGKADAQATASSACTKHEADMSCTCATVTTTVYAGPPTEGHSGSPTRETAPPLEMTPYYPSAPTDSVYDSETPIETPTGGHGYESVEQPSTTSTPCTASQTLRITISTPPVSTTEAPAPPPIVIISGPRSKPCNSSTSENLSTSVATTTNGTEIGYLPSSSTTSQLRNRKRGLKPRPMQHRC